MFKQRIFVSSTSRDLGSYRRLASESLRRRGYVVDDQSIFNLTYLEIHQKLKQRIAACDAVVCLIGFYYGGEPSDRPPDQPRRSYTQWEYHFARELRKPVYLLLADEKTPFDPYEAELDELRQLQKDYRAEVTRDRDWRPFTNADQLRAELAELRFPWEGERIRRIALVVLSLGLILVLGFGSYFAYKRKLIFYDDPCDPKNRLLLHVQEPEKELKDFEPQESFREDPQHLQTPPSPELFRCSLTIFNKTGKPIRLWRYLPKPLDKPNSSKEAWPDISDQARDQGWIPTYTCNEETKGLNAIGGWAYIVIENLEDSLEIARHRTGSPDDANPLSVYVKGWFYFPYDKETIIEIEKPFFDHPDIAGNFVLTSQ